MRTPYLEKSRLTYRLRSLDWTFGLQPTSYDRKTSSLYVSEYWMTRNQVGSGVKAIMHSLLDAPVGLVYKLFATD